MKSLGRTRTSLLRRCLVIALPIILFAIIWVMHWFYDPRVGTLVRQARQYAGWAGIGAVDCGLIYSYWFEDGPARHSEVIDKALTAYEQGKPFSIGCQFDAYDRQSYYVLMGTRDGRIFELSQGTYERGRVMGKVSIEDLSHLREGDFETNLKRHLHVSN